MKKDTFQHQYTLKRPTNKKKATGFGSPRPARWDNIPAFGDRGGIFPYLHGLFVYLLFKDVFAW
jgi:hypothetical protein